MEGQENCASADDSELGRLDAVATAERIRAGELLASEAVAAAIDRAKALEPTLNAITTEHFQSALSRSEVRAAFSRKYWLSFSPIRESATVSQWAIVPHFWSNNHRNSP